MRHLLIILSALFLCAAPAQAQTMKALMFNSTNGQVVANTGTNVLTFTNTVSFKDGNNVDFLTIEEGRKIKYLGDTKIYLEEMSFAPSVTVVDDIESPTNIFTISPVAATTRANLGFSTNLSTLWTATNIYIATDALGFSLDPDEGGTKINAAGGLWDTESGEYSLRFQDGDPLFGASVNKALWRTNLGLPLAALTNTSNVTMMRALAGSTNTNQPFSGIIQYADSPGGDIYNMIVSNGIILKTEIQ